MMNLKTNWPVAIALAVTLIAAVMPLEVLGQNTLTEGDKKRILDRLEELRKGNLEAKFGRFANALAAFQAASESPAKSYEFYMDCYKVVNYDRKGLKAGEYREWKTKNIKRMRETAHATALQFQLRYLVMTIRAVHMEDTSEMIEPLMAFVQAGIAKQEFMGEHFGKLGGSVTATIFAQAYEIDKTLNVGEDVRWSLNPMGIRGHYNAVIFPPLREEGDSRGLERAWDGLIALEIAMMEPVKEEIRKEDFVQKKLPQLKWAKWMDVAENGERARAAMQLLIVLEGNLRHENAEGWIKQLIEVVEGGTLGDDAFDTAETD